MNSTDKRLQLTAFGVLSFDCYGTLIDWETGILRALDPLMSKSSGRPSQEQLLQSFAIHESEQQIQTPGMVYSELLATVHEGLCRQWDIPAVEADHEAFGQSIGQWPAFPDSVAALQYLKQYYKLVILSNVDRRSFEQTNKSLGVEFDAMYIAEDIGSYKPDARNFEYLITHLKEQGFGKEHLLHVAQSLFHDHVPAKALGLRTAWIDRHQGKPGAVIAAHADVTYDFRFNSMADLVSAHQDELRGRSQGRDAMTAP
jgi:2-haloacid dehalogenase